MKRGLSLEEHRVFDNFLREFKTELGLYFNRMAPKLKKDHLALKKIIKISNEIGRLRSLMDEMAFKISNQEQDEN